MTDDRRRTGQIAEDVVAQRLIEQSWEIVERNARTRYGELDIVALDGPILVFVEVKGARAGTRFGPEKPILSIDFTKQRQVRRLGTAWMAERREFPPFDDIRFDAVGVTLDRAGRAVEIEHIEAAF
ncbi:MAG TPA: YraN family protein [Solirubrobacterales bacterium]|jgi:putative endonuclease|nr:YraN family protein [Solirubrobacterales bacterium]